MNIFFYCYMFFFRNTRFLKSSNKFALVDNDNDNNKTNNIHINKNYIFELIDNFYDNLDNINELEFTDDELKLIEDILSIEDEDENNIDYNNIYEANNIVNKNIMLGINYAYPYEDQDNNNKILNDINKNLYLKKQKNILIDNNISNDIKLKIANEYLTMNTTKCLINIVSGGLYDDWLFNF